MISFRTFWVVALLSNMAATAQWTAVGWALGDTDLPAAILLLGQVSGAVGAVVGTVAGVGVIRRLGYRRTLIVSSALEAISCLGIGAVSFSSDGVLSVGQATTVAGVNLLGPFAVSLGGPAWVSLVAEWPGTTDRPRQLLLDSMQFQAGRTLGPLVGGAILALTVHAVQWASALNAASFGLVIACLAVKGRTAADRSVETRSPRLRPGRELLRNRAMWGVVAVAAGADAGRVYLPRLVQQVGEGQLTYAVIQSLLTGAAIAAAAATARARPADRTMAVAGLGALALGLASWGAAGAAGAATWVTGAILLGAGTSLATAALTSLMITAAGEFRIASAVATVELTRTVTATGAGVVLAAVVGVLGTVAYLPLAAVGAAAALGLRRAGASPPQRDASAPGTTT